MGTSLVVIVVVAAPLLAGVTLIVLSRRQGPDAPRTAMLGSGLVIILLSFACLASVLLVQYGSARAARRAEIEALRAQEEAQEAIIALIAEGNRLANEAAAERAAAQEPAAAEGDEEDAPGETGETTDEGP